MKIQAIKNYGTTRNYQANKTNQQPEIMNQPSFGNVIVDERGIERLKGEQVRTAISIVLKNIKASLGEFKGSEQADVLVYPFQVESGSAGLAVEKPNNSLSLFWYGNDTFSSIRGGKYLDSSSTSLKRFIQGCLWDREAPKTFAEQVKANRVPVKDIFLDVEKPLPEEVLQRRFHATNLSIKVD